MDKLSEKQIARFWAKVNIQGPDDCWEWQAAITKHGYGSYGTHRGTHVAHRVAYYLTYGPIPEGLCCCHKCDNRACVNPRHIFLGTKQDNSNDMTIKNRQAIGIRISKTKLTEEQVLEIRRLYDLESHLSQEKIAILFGVSQTTIHQIIFRKSWKHI